MSHGNTTPEFETVRNQFDALMQNVEVGAGLTIYHQGIRVVDLWQGHRDRDQSIAWTRDTLSHIYSATKGITAMAVAMLVDQGKLQYDAPVTEYWPEFGAESKSDITLQCILSHQAGLYQFSPAVTVSQLYDWPGRTRQLAAQPAIKDSGFAYHAITWGYLVGEVIRRVTRQSVGEFIARNIAEPLKADFVLGINAEADFERCAEMIGPNHAKSRLSSAASASKLDIESSGAAAGSPERTESEATRLLTHDPVLRPFGDICSRQYRAAEIPATNGHSTSDGLARCYDAFIHGQLVSHDTLQIANCELTDPDQSITDRVLGQRLRRSHGFILNSPDCYMGPARAAFGHPGTAGCVAFGDPDNGVAFAYTPNQLVNGVNRSRSLIDTFYDCL